MGMGATTYTLFAASPRIVSVPPEATARLRAKVEAAKRERERERFWQAVQALRQPR